jgi:hypothetical protein
MQLGGAITMVSELPSIWDDSDLTTGEKLF